MIIDPNNPSLEANVRVLLDICLQRSYISQRLGDKTLGSESEQLTDCDLTTICMTSVEPGEISMYLNAYTVPFICSPVSSQCIDLAQKNYSHVMDLKLADSSEGTFDLEADCMIGSFPDTSVHLMSTHVICSQTKSQPKSNCQIREELSKFWQLENSGVESEKWPCL